MEKIVIKRDNTLIKEFDLKKLPMPITIGSAPSNIIQLKDDAIAPIHLFIEKVNNVYFIKALQSEFDILLNEEKISSQTAFWHGDIIKIGDHRISFIVDESEVSDNKSKTVLLEQDTDKANEKTVLVDQDKNTAIEKTIFLDIDADTIAEKTVLLDQDTDSANEGTVLVDENEKTSLIDDDVATFPQAEYCASPPNLPHYLIAIYGPYKGKRYKLKLTDTKIGRDKQLNDIIIDKTPKQEPDKNISRRHATIHYRNGSYFVSDKRSGTRTNLNHHKLGVNEILPLKLNDEIEIISTVQSTIFRFVRDGEWNVAPAHKTGVWYVRYRFLFNTIVSILVLATSLYFLYHSLTRKATINHRPDPLTIREELWLSGNGVLSEAAISNPSMDDLNGNGILDLTYINSANHIVCINCLTKKPLWTEISDIDVISPSSVVLADMNNNGLKDIIVAGKNSRIYLIDGNNGLLISKSDFLSGNFVGSPTIADFNHDGYNDVAICSEDGKLYIGVYKVNQMTWEGFNTNDITKSTPTIINDQIFMGTENGKIKVFNIFSKTLETIDVDDDLNAFKGTMTEANSIRANIGFSKVTPVQSIFVASTRQFNIISYNLTNRERLWYDEYEPPSGQLLPEIYPAPVCGDITGDGYGDIIFACYNGIIKGYEGDLKISKTSIWEYRTQRGNHFISNPALVDINKDKIVDVVACGTSGKLFIIDGITGKEIYVSDVRTAYSTTPVIGDIDNDCYLDILCLADDYNIYRYRTNAKVLKGTSLWSQMSGTSYHSGQSTYRTPDTKKENITMLISMCAIVSILLLHIRNRAQQKKMIQQLTGLVAK